MTGSDPQQPFEVRTSECPYLLDRLAVMVTAQGTDRMRIDEKALGLEHPDVGEGP
jgi:hypothetical protein